MGMFSGATGYLSFQRGFVGDSSGGLLYSLWQQTSNTGMLNVSPFSESSADSEITHQYGHDAALSRSLK